MWAAPGVWGVTLLQLAAAGGTNSLKDVLPLKYKKRLWANSRAVLSPFAYHIAGNLARIADRHGSCLDGLMPALA